MPPGPTGCFPRELLEQRPASEFDAGVVRAVACLVPRCTIVIDLGAGTGGCVRELTRRGYAATGVDGGQDVERITGGVVQHCELTGDCGAFADAAEWGLLIEVGEHVPAALEDRLAANVGAIVRRGLLVTWAACAAYGHVNCRSPEYVANLFGRHGWRLDEALTRDAQQAAGHSERRGRLLVFLKG